MRWTVVIPAKSLPEAKSRLLPTTGDEQTHARLVLALRADTMAAARNAPNVARLLLVLDRPPTGPSAGMLTPAEEAIVQQEPGLNAALGAGAAHASARWPSDAIAALVGDLPALTGTELADALELAAAYDRAFVADTAGTGTTLLTVRPGTDLMPMFGPGSAGRHRAAAALLPAAPGLRQDVDTGADLAAALELGVGPATLAALRSGPTGSGSDRRSPVVHLDSA